VKSLGTAPGFHHVAIRAVDFDETIRFYTEGLGFRVHFPFSVPGRIDRAAFLDAGDGRFIEVFGPGSIVQAQHFANDVRISAKSASPKFIPENHDAIVKAISIVGVGKVSAQHRRYAESAKKTGGNRSVRDLLRRAVARKVGFVVVEGRDFFKRMVLRADVPEIGLAKGRLINANTQARLVQLNQVVGVAKGQRLNKSCVEDAEDDSAGADAQSEHRSAKDAQIFVAAQVAQ